MSTVSEHDQATAPSGTKSHRGVYLLIAGVLVALLVVGLITYNSQKDSRAAQQKAAQLQRVLARADLPTGERDTIVRLLGTDGGAVCAAPNDPLLQAQLKGQLTNGAAGPAMRPVQVDRSVVRGEALILAVYCPEKLPEYRDLVDSFDYDSTIRR